jgi:hypothetical protein
MSIFSILGVVGYKCMLVLDERQRKRMQSHQGYLVCDDRQKRKHNHWRNAKALSMINEMSKKTGKIGSEARMRKTTPKQRSRIAKHAAITRWRKPKLIEIPAK